jgi:hypothetical protein
VPHRALPQKPNNFIVVQIRNVAALPKPTTLG